MRIGVPKETRPGETRVAATPKTVVQLIALGHEVHLESGAGVLASFTDHAYQEAGASITPTDEVWGCGFVVKINPPSDTEIAKLRPGAMLAGLLAPALSPELLDKLTAQGVTALAMDAVPRISRAQALDVLSSMANIAGYRAVIEAAHEFGSLFTGQITAAGKVPPAKVLVVGAGVAGLAAIGTAHSLGAIVRAFDARPEVGEQVESMGGEFLKIDIEQAAPSADGYAKETSQDFNRLAEELYAAQATEVDIIITTALIPGRPAPKLISAAMVASMKPGSVIVDMAAANGGNCELSRPDELVMSDNGVRIIGYTDLPGRLPTQSSQLYGTNIVNLMKLLTPGKDGQVVLDFDDVVQRGWKLFATRVADDAHELLLVEIAIRAHRRFDVLGTLEGHMPVGIAGARPVLGAQQVADDGRQVAVGALGVDPRDGARDPGECDLREILGDGRGDPSRGIAHDPRSNGGEQRVERGCIAGASIPDEPCQLVVRGAPGSGGRHDDTVPSEGEDRRSGGSITGRAVRAAPVIIPKYDGACRCVRCRVICRDGCVISRSSRVAHAVIPVSPASSA